jgi:hypothetical protein
MLGVNIRDERSNLMHYWTGLKQGMSFSKYQLSWKKANRLNTSFNGH